MNQKKTIPEMLSRKNSIAKNIPAVPNTIVKNDWTEGETNIRVLIKIFNPDIMSMFAQGLLNLSWIQPKIEGKRLSLAIAYQALLNMKAVSQRELAVEVRTARLINHAYEGTMF